MRLPTCLRRLVLLAALCALLPGCQLFWGKDEVGLRGASAIVVYDRSRTEDAHRAFVILRREGMSVEKQVQGPIGPERSSLRIHDTGEFPERGTRLREVLPKSLDVEWMEFTRKEEKDVYLWLVAE